MEVKNVGIMLVVLTILSVLGVAMFTQPIEPLDPLDDPPVTTGSSVGVNKLAYDDRDSNGRIDLVAFNFAHDEEVPVKIKGVEVTSGNDTFLWEIPAYLVPSSKIIRMKISTEPGGISELTPGSTYALKLLASSSQEASLPDPYLRKSLAIPSLTYQSRTLTLVENQGLDRYNYMATVPLADLSFPDGSNGTMVDQAKLRVLGPVGERLPFKVFNSSMVFKIPYVQAGSSLQYTIMHSSITLVESDYDAPIIETIMTDGRTFYSGTTFAPDDDGFVRDWLVFGSFANDKVERNATFEDLVAYASGGTYTEAQVKPYPTMSYGSPQGSWNYVHRDDFKLDFKEHFVTNTDWKAAYAFAYVVLESTEATNVELKLGSDDGILIWFQGEKVFSTVETRALDVDDDTVPLTLTGGVYPVLLKVENTYGSWSTCLRLTTSGTNYKVLLPVEGDIYNFEHPLIRSLS